MTLREPQGGADEPSPVPEAAAPATAESQVFRARARKAPKLGAFLTLGGGLGAVVAFVLVMVHRAVEDPNSVANDDLGVWIFVVFFFCIGAGLLLAGLLALVLDRASRRRARLVTVERGEVAAEPDAAPAEADRSEAAPEGAAPQDAGDEPAGA